MGATDAKTFPGEANICLLLACFADRPGHLPEEDGAREAFGWLLSKRPARHSFMGADQVPFMILCRDYLNVRVMVYHLKRDENNGEIHAHLGDDTHPEDPHLETVPGLRPPPKAVRRLVFSNSHFVRFDDAREDRDVQRALQQFSAHVSPSLALLRQDLDRDLHRHVTRAVREKEEEAEAEKKKKKQQMEEVDAETAAALVQEEEERFARVRAETDRLIAVQRREEAQKRRQIEMDADMATALTIAFHQDASSALEVVA